MEDITSTTEQIEQIYDPDLRGEVSPFRIPISRGKNQQKEEFINHNIFELTDYKWYTSDFRRMFEYDYYNKIYQDIGYFPIPEKYDNTFLGQGKKAIDDLYGNGKNYINGVVTEAKNAFNNTKDSVKSLFGADDEEKDISKQITTNFNAYLNSFQKIKVLEFKPDDMLTMRLNLITAFFKTYTSDKSNISSDSITQKFLDYMADSFDKIKATLKTIQIQWDNIKSMDSTQRIGFAIEMYKNIISGFYTASYEFPLLDGTGRNLFLNSDGKEGWSQQSFMNRFHGQGDESIISKVSGFIKGTAEMLGVQGFDIASRPKWGLERGGSVYNEGMGVEVKFMLYNNDLHSFKANTKLINCFVGGNLWLQDTFIQKSSSLYTVEIPGRAYLSLCSASIKVSFVGKIRKLPEPNAGYLTQCTEDKDTGQAVSLRKLDSAMYNKQILLNIPDAYEVTIVFNSLLPNNFNTYMMNINKVSNIQVGQQITSYYEKFLENVKTQIDIENQQKVNATRGVANGEALA